MTTLNIDLPKELEKRLTYLEIISKRQKSFFVKEALKNYLVKDPVNLGKPLLYAYKGLYHYLFWIIYQIKQTELLILILEADHRREIYK